MAFLQKNQLDIMLFLGGVCAVLAVLTWMTTALTPKRRRILAMMEAAAALLLIADRYAYLYRGDPSTLGWWMVRICNFLVFFLPLDLGHGFTLYLCDLYRNEGGMKKLPKRLQFCEVLFALGLVLLVISQFTGLYYYFEGNNIYHRSPGFAICYVIPILILVIQMSVVVQYGAKVRRDVQFSLVIYVCAPIAASLIQLFAYGISLTNLMIAFVVALLYLYALSDLNEALETARAREFELLREEQKHERVMFEQTAEALVSAIEAKDRYTNGHSKRVAEYSRSIARSAGKSEEECEDIYFAALLHDVGKINVPLKILNKKGHLNDEEYNRVKQHPVVGGQILSNIQLSPEPRIAALYHHERYDGRGYPEGLKGEAIPETARIIAVADAYDAMTSNRSYRRAIAQEQVREELEKGAGTQFDPEFARAMISMVDQDTDYRMREMEPGERPDQTEPADK